ncbi:MAG: TauD/TfdA family dioxygenase [Gammaproteobacteria bacterium]|nr:TauD/TfdA family dioxygenase [Gammaproteobacteria bacterium]
MSVELRRLHHAFGMQIEGIDLRRLDDAEFAWINEQYKMHSLLLFPGQALEPHHQVALGRRFGVPSIPPRQQFNLPNHPEVSILGNSRSEQGEPIGFFNEMGVEWHSDSAGYENLDGVTFLYALTVPPMGGETMFCSMCEAWDALSEAERKDLRGRKVLHSWNYHNDKVMAISAGEPLSAEQRAQRPDYWTELVQSHPVSGRMLYYLSHNLVKQIDDLDEVESQRLAMRLVDHATAAERVYSHRWCVGDLVLWDNRSLMHSATDVGVYRDALRVLHRSYSFTGPRALAGGRLAQRY